MSHLTLLVVFITDRVNNTIDKSTNIKCACSLGSYISGVLGGGKGGGDWGLGTGDTAAMQPQGVEGNIACNLFFGGGGGMSCDAPFI